MLLKMPRDYVVPVTITVQVRVRAYDEDDARDRVDSESFDVNPNRLTFLDTDCNIGEPEIDEYAS